MQFYRILIFLCLVGPCGHGQILSEEFGNVSRHYLEMKTYEPDTTARAIILLDKGETIIEPQRGTKYTIHRRIKFFKKDAAEEWANIKVVASRFKTSSLKGISYNLVNDSIVKSEISEEFRVKNKFNRNLDELELTFPNIHDGTIIEYTFTIIDDDSYNLRSWSFQHTIPVIRSQYSLFCPFIEKVKIDIRGAFSVSKFNESSSGNRHTWIMKNMPAFKPEPLMPDPNLYKSMINFWSSEATWQKIYNDLTYRFNGIKKVHIELIKTVKSLTQDLTDPRAKMKVISEYIKKNVQWNGICDFDAYSTKEVLEKGRGSSGDINLLLAAMLERAGLNVNLVLLSTRENGAIIEDFPSLRQFNYIICLVPIDNGYVLMDATEKNAPYDLLPPHCTNLTGLLLTGLGYQWVDLTTKINFKTSVVADLELSNETDLKGTVKFTRSGYEALQARNEYSKKGEQLYLRDRWDGRLVNIETNKVEGIDSVFSPLEEIYSMTFQDRVTTAGNMLYIDPFIVMKENLNPFRNETRLYPIDFGIGKDELLICNITFPEDYVIKQLPESKNIVLSGNGAKFAVNYTTLGNRIHIACTFQVSRTLFNELEYAAVRELFNQVISKKSEPIVLERTK